jgi:serine phosphatase RsbU (regulator of sigma subunit)
MRLGISTKAIIVLLAVIAAATAACAFFIQDAMLDHYLRVRNDHLASVASAVDELIAADIKEASTPDFSRMVDILSLRNPERIIISDMNGLILFDSRRTRTGSNLDLDEEMRIKPDSDAGVLLLRTSENLKAIYLHPKQVFRLLDSSEDVSLVYYAPIRANGGTSGQAMVSESVAKLGPIIRLTRNKLIIFMSALFLATGAAVFFLVNKSVAAPIMKLADLTKRIARKDFQERVDFRTSDEISYLGRSFNTMVYNLEKMVREIEEQNDGLIHLSGELELRNEELNKKQRLIEYDLRLAHRVQQELLPQTYPRIEGVLISAANFQVGEIGGDCFDFYKLDDYRLGAFIGDVSGKGIAAALVMAMSTILFSQLKDRLDEPSVILGRVNEIMYRHFGSQHSIYLTCFFLILDSRNMKLSYSCAGHTPPLLFRPSTGEIFNLESEGFGLGMFNNVAYEQKTIDVMPGDKIILYTDGVTDCRDSDGQMFGHERLVEMVKNNPDSNTYRLTHFIVEELGEFAGAAARQDDLTLLILELENDKK